MFTYQLCVELGQAGLAIVVEDQNCVDHLGICITVQTTCLNNHCAKKMSISAFLVFDIRCSVKLSCTSSGVEV